MNKLLASALIISSLISISAFAVSPPAPNPTTKKQVSGYYQYQSSDVQIKD